MTPSVTNQLEFPKNTGLPLQVRGKNFRKVNKEEEQENKGRTVTDCFLKMQGGMALPLSLPLGREESGLST